MTCVVDLLQLCMIVLSQLTTLNAQTTERHTTEVLGAIERARDGAHAVTEQAKADLERYMAGRSIQFGDHMADHVAGKLERTIEQRVNQVPLRTALCVGAVLIGLGLAGGWAGRSWWGFNTVAVEAATRAATTETVLQAIRDVRGELGAIATVDGAPSARHWRDLMEWNPIEAALNQCKTNPDLSFHDANGRPSCNIPLWIAPLGSKEPMVPLPAPKVPPPSTNQTDSLSSHQMHIGP